MSTPVHDDDDVSGVTSNGAPPGTEEASAASIESVTPAEFAGADSAGRTDNLVEVDSLVEADNPADADRPAGDDSPVAAEKSDAAEELASLSTETAAFVADLRARMNRPMPRPRSMQAPARA